jgi:hypothetical protein
MLRSVREALVVEVIEVMVVVVKGGLIVHTLMLRKAFQFFFDMGLSKKN